MANLITLDNGTGTLTVRVDRIEAVTVLPDQGWVVVQLIGGGMPQRVHFKSRKLMRTNTDRLFAAWGKVKL